MLFVVEGTVHPKIPTISYIIWYRSRRNTVNDDDDDDDSDDGRLAMIITITMIMMTLMMKTKVTTTAINTIKTLSFTAQNNFIFCL